MIKDLTGQRFGRLMALEFAGIKKHRAQWQCKCDCGNICVVDEHSLHIGNTKSCGCLQSERFHGKSKTKIYRTWRGIKKRCLKPNHMNYKNYGGRGITVCDEWCDNFQAFFDYVSKLDHFGEEGYTLDRIDNNGNYEPGNVRWATDAEQRGNRRSSRLVEYDGKQMTIRDAAKYSGIKIATLQTRYGKGWRGEKLFQPVK